jgi:hypothetical protein
MPEGCLPSWSRCDGWSIGAQGLDHVGAEALRTGSARRQHRRPCAGLPPACFFRSYHLLAYRRENAERAVRRCFC